MRFFILLFVICTGAVAAECGKGTVSIESVQGLGSVSPYEGKVVTVEGVVTAVFQRTNQLGGFFIQEPDGDPKASHALFVYNDSPVQKGERLQIRGRVKEFYGLTELTNVAVTARCGESTLPYLPMLPERTSPQEREALEGVLVQVPVSNLAQHHELARYGQLGISFDWVSDSKATDWFVDDASSKTNPTVIHYLPNNLVQSDWVLGNQIEAFTAVVTYGFGQYRLLPIQNIKAVENQSLSSREADAIRLVAINAQNLFNGNGRGGAFLKNRGPKNESELNIKLQRLSDAIAYVDADVLVLNEIENDGFGSLSAVEDLLTELNESKNGAQYKAVEFSSKETGMAAIQNVILYRESRVLPVGKRHSITSLASWEGRWHRPFLLQPFETTSGKQFQVVAAHLKSKGGQCPSDTKESRAEFGACVAERDDAIGDLNLWLSSLEKRPTFLMGDLNAVPQEPSIQSLIETDWSFINDLNKHYSYVFQGQPLLLDYILVKNMPASADLKLSNWNINSGVLRFDQQTRLGISTDLFENFSDHDPVVMDIKF